MATKTTLGQEITHNNLSFFTFYGQELNKAQTWAKVHRIPFPKIDEQKTMAEIGVRECYVFENQENPNSPIILHFPLVNMNFRKYSAPGVVFMNFKSFENI